MREEDLKDNARNCQYFEGWIRQVAKGAYGKPILAFRQPLHNSRACGDKLNADRVWIDLKDDTLSIEDDGGGISGPLRSILDLNPRSTAEPAMLSKFGEGLKLATLALTRMDGLILIFVRQGQDRAILAWDLDDQTRAAQSWCLWLPPTWEASEESHQSQRELEEIYSKKGWADAQKTINRLCSMPTRTGFAGNRRSPYRELSDLAQRFDQMAARSGKDSGVRIEIHRPSAPDIPQLHKIGSLECSVSADGLPDITLTARDGSDRQSLRYLLAQLFLPSRGQSICAAPFWKAKQDGNPVPHQLRMYINGEAVSTASNLWAQARQLHAAEQQRRHQQQQPPQQPEPRSSLIPIKLLDGTEAGRMQVLAMPDSVVSQMELPAETKATGVLYVLPRSDAMANIFPEMPDFDGGRWQRYAESVRRPDIGKAALGVTIWGDLLALAGGEDALRCGKLLTKGEFDKMIRPREKMANGSLPKMQPGHNFLRRISLSQHLILLQADELDVDASKSSKLDPGTPFAQAFFRALIRYFKTQWRQERLLLKEEEAQALQQAQQQGVAQDGAQPLSAEPSSTPETQQPGGEQQQEGSPEQSFHTAQHNPQSSGSQATVLSGPARRPGLRAQPEQLASAASAPGPVQVTPSQPAEAAGRAPGAMPQQAGGAASAAAAGTDSMAASDSHPGSTTSAERTVAQLLASLNQQAAGQQAPATAGAGAAQASAAAQGPQQAQPQHTQPRTPRPQPPRSRPAGGRAAPATATPTGRARDPRTAAAGGGQAAGSSRGTRRPVREPQGATGTSAGQDSHEAGQPARKKPKVTQPMTHADFQTFVRVKKMELDRIWRQMPSKVTKASVTQATRTALAVVKEINSKANALPRAARASGAGTS